MVKHMLFSFKNMRGYLGEGSLAPKSLRTPAVGCVQYIQTYTTVYTLHMWELPSVSTLSQCMFDSKQTQSNINTVNDQMTLQQSHSSRCICQLAVYSSGHCCNTIGKEISGIWAVSFKRLTFD